MSVTTVNHSTMSMDAEILIIGAGIAGISAAHKLIKSGFHNVRILEATARSGGRVKTGRFGEKIHTTIETV